MIYFKVCPKCNGDMYLEQDEYGIYRKCLQCGRTVEQLAQSQATKDRAA